MVDLYNHTIIVDYINKKIKKDEVDEPDEIIGIMGGMDGLGEPVEDNDIQQEKYQKMLLKCLYCDEYNDRDVVDRIDNIYNIVKNNECIQKYCAKVQQSVPMLSLMPNVDKKAPNSFMFLFAYDYFEYFHLCLVDLIDTGDITPENNEFFINKL